jgi:hypothetical protein
VLFEENEIRRIYDKETETLFFSVVDIIKWLVPNCHLQADLWPMPKRFPSIDYIGLVFDSPALGPCRQDF